MEKIQPAITILERIFTKLDKSDFLVNSELSSSSQKSTITEVASKSNISMKTESIFSSIEEDLKQVKSNILASLDCDHPFLSLVAQSYFHLKGKHFRPTVLLTLSRALAFDSSQGNISQVTPKQLQLAEIVEMIHTASIIHDDVIDKAETRRGEPSINYQFGNKVAILSGDFLLARASIRLSYLENFEVTRLISTVIAELVEGELMQIKPTSLDSPEIAFQQYLDKTYKKTASLIANGCRAVALLGECNSTLVEIATNYGKNLGLAFQLIDDLLDFTGSQQTLGKPAAVDLSLGLATAPVLFAREEFPELSEMIERKFEREGDVLKARKLVEKSQGLKKTRELAQVFRDKAVEAIQPLKPSAGKTALLELADLVLNRKK